tara:strand:+ start:1309 stop:2277 length:969 start_codon:yes stop_codon:yes gene_type:complete
MLDKDFFKKYQRFLVWFANTRFGRWFFRIHNDVPKDKIILEVLPNKVMWFDRIEGNTYYYTHQFRTHDKFAKRINALVMWMPFNTYKRIRTDGQWMLVPKVGLACFEFNPDPDAESTSVDGHCAEEIGLGDTWSNIHGGAGTISSDDETFLFCARIESLESDWKNIFRGVVLFDTSSLDDAISIGTTTLSLRGTAKKNEGSLNLNVNIYSSAPASNTAVVAGDFNSLGTTAFSTAISHASFSTSAYNDFVLNASGVAQITATGVSKFGMRNETYDALNVEPSHPSSVTDNSVSCSAADEAGTSQDPKLEVCEKTFTPRMIIY